MRALTAATLARQIEGRYEKDEILGFYLNSIYWGRGAIGIESAAQVYFAIPASELDVNQLTPLQALGIDPAEPRGPARRDARCPPVATSSSSTGATPSNTR